jgi:signal transduction histidine kinase
MRAPLRSMRSYAELLETEHATELSPEARHYLERINVNAARLDLLVRDVLAYSRVAKEQIETKPVDLHHFVSELLEQMSDDAVAPLPVTILGSLPPVVAHEAYLLQIFTNLIANGLKFVRPGQAPRVEISANDNVPFVTLSIRDHGIGIDPADFGLLFQIFGRLNPDHAYEGTGIGLAIVKKAVQRMGGELGVDSAVGKGATFWFTLPRA